MEFFVCFFSVVLFAVLFNLFVVSTVSGILVVFSNMPEFFCPSSSLANVIQLLLYGHHYRLLLSKSHDLRLWLGCLHVGAKGHSSLVVLGHGSAVAKGPSFRLCVCGWTVAWDRVRVLQVTCGRDGFCEVKCRVGEPAEPRVGDRQSAGWP